MAPRSVLVTGASGLIGFDLVRRLHAEGHKVVAVDRSVAEFRSVTETAFEVEIGDVHKLHELAARFDVDAIVHCGGVSGPMVGKNNPAMVFNVNVGGTVDVAEVARQLAVHRGSCRLVYCSSLMVYGDQPQDGIDESHRLLTRNCYASSKVAAEAVVLAYAEEHNVDAAILRIASVYGPRRRTSCTLRDMIEDALAGRHTHLPFGEDSRRQWVHVDDVVAGIIAALNAPALKRRVYNISAGVKPQVGEAASLIREFIPGADIKFSGHGDVGYTSVGLLSIDAAHEDLGYVPEVSLRVGIKTLVDAMRH
ncbi:NAD(P)-dependent oxidoreductase [Mesorhizobium sp. M7A.F.Ca.US.006.01.1.1]|uniref:NAD-dependent epimerase/dehydratase family protein n=1 Tax=Mesorhizobium sp. M7A.F.Ca.US.006.01.1.1 TaxID=2496707 RepID=UPI000FCCC865|nr:NAD(P)-dependent oxidoreductase [Mesorhizobium sp. M7A.F.Ca.US.006.01.1.1]RUZ72514.1 NAD(P)-dependent oxidoreductase [Mesorhizobium sp. M7A.F.Ca.US.006.01.1.1]